MRRWEENNALEYFMLVNHSFNIFNIVYRTRLFYSLAKYVVL